MVICPVAIAVGCKKCPIFKVCPAKSIIGDQKSVEDDKKSTPASKTKKPGKDEDAQVCELAAEYRPHLQMLNWQQCSNASIIHFPS